MRLLITAGPTREPLDPVRFISNRSSGKMGYAVAAAAARRGHRVVLVSGPVAIKPPAGVIFRKVETAAQMLSAVKAGLEKCDALVMAAAVADWRPATCARRKIKKNKMPAALPLKKNPDILMAVAPQKGKKIFVGFAAETDDSSAEPRRKLRQKKLDLIVANNVKRPGSGFETDTNRVTFYFADGKRKKLPRRPKKDIADRIVAWVEKERQMA